MSFFAFFVSLLVTFLLGLTGAPQQAANSRDIERKNDINTVYAQLETYYNDNGDYPTEKAITLDYDQKLPGLNPEALLDPNGGNINAGDYSYTASGCSALGCRSYSLSAKLEDGTLYEKQSLN